MFIVHSSEAPPSHTAKFEAKFKWKAIPFNEDKLKFAKDNISQRMQLRQMISSSSLEREGHLGRGEWKLVKSACPTAFHRELDQIQLWWMKNSKRRAFCQLPFLPPCHQGILWYQA